MLVKLGFSELALVSSKLVSQLGDLILQFIVFMGLILSAVALLLLKDLDLPLKYLILCYHAIMYLLLMVQLNLLLFQTIQQPLFHLFLFLDYNFVTLLQILYFRLEVAILVHLYPELLGQLTLLVRPLLFLLLQLSLHLGHDIRL